MLLTKDIREVARLLLDAGYRSRYSADNLPAYQAAIQKVKPMPGSVFVDELCFVQDKDAKRLYLRNRIDFDWLAARVELRGTLKSDPGGNSIYDAADYIEIAGGTEDPPPTP